MDNTTIQTPGVSKSKWGGYGCAFFLGFSIPMLLFAFAFFRRLLRRLFAPSRWFTEVQMRHSIPLLLLFLLGLLLTACSGQTGASSPPPKVSRFDAQAAFASYVGKWEVHGALLTITSNRTGLENWNVGPCTQPLTDNTPLCNGNAKITFTVNVDGSIKGTFQSVWYTQWSDAPVPAGFHTDPENPQAGDTFELKHVKAHLLYTTWFGRLSTHNSYNRYWCDSSTSPADRPLCGA